MGEAFKPLEEALARVSTSDQLGRGGKSYWKREAILLGGLLSALQQRAEAAEAMHVAIKGVAETCTRLIGGKYVARTRKSSNALEALFVANRDYAALARSEEA